MTSLPMKVTTPVGEPWTPTDATFGARLALVRQAMAWGNVKEAALACGFPPESWRNWERDGRIPRDLVGVAQRVAAVTGCSFAWLAGVTEQPAALPEQVPA